MVIAVTGASGQLGQALQYISKEYPEISFVFWNSQQANVCSEESLRAAFLLKQPDYCINAAAYTAVDKAESEPEKAHLVNVIGARNLAKVCLEFNTKLIHISTDFVFDGTHIKPYLETDETKPLGVYGQTKLDGERQIQEILEEHIIIRTSWVYSKFANNFMKTMLRLASERSELSVVNDQIGTPTYAVDLARVVVQIAASEQPDYGVYHFSNEGQTSWYGFARQIFDLSGSGVQLTGIPTSAYPTPAKRPAYSVLNKSRIKSVFGLSIRDWKSALAEAITS